MFVSCLLDSCANDNRRRNDNRKERERERAWKAREREIALTNLGYASREEMEEMKITLLCTFGIRLLHFASSSEKGYSRGG